MFWQYNTTSSPHFESILQKENVTLQELMDDDDIIQECKLQNKKLVDFLCKRNVLEELVTLITEEPSEDLDERTRFKYPNIACELLTCDVPALNESLSRDNELLEKLYSFIDKDPPLNPLLASFLSRTLGILIVKRLEKAMGFLKNKENFISLLLKHLGTSAIMDLTLKLITEVGDVESRQNLLNWLDSQNLVQSLIALFDPKVDSERQHNASQLICDVLRLSRDNLNDNRDRLETDPILARLESPETVALLLDNMLGLEKSESSIVGGIQVLLCLLGHKNNFQDNTATYNNAYDEIESDRKQKIIHSTALVIANRLKDFHQILLDPPAKPYVKTSIACLDPPLGNTRLQIVKLLSALIALDKPEVLREIIQLGIVEVLLDLFFKYVWNNFLHAQVEHCIAGALGTHVKPAEDEDATVENMMYPYLIIKCRLINRILEAWTDNEQKQSKPKGIRQGYMGHLINIANEIVNRCGTNISLDRFINTNLDKTSLDAWNNFVTTSLAETNRTQRVVLGGVHPSNCNDENNENYNIPYSQTVVLQSQSYSEFQQQMTSDIPSYGFHNNDYIDTDNSILQSIDRNSSYNVMGNNDTSSEVEAFRKVCASYIIDDSDSILDEPSTLKSSDSWEAHDSDEEETATAWSNLESNKNAIQHSILEPKDPWTNLDTDKEIVLDGWADFGNFNAKFEDLVAEPNANVMIPTKFVNDIQSTGDQTLDISIPNPSVTVVNQLNEISVVETSVDNQTVDPVNIIKSNQLDIQQTEEVKTAAAMMAEATVSTVASEIPPVESLPNVEVSVNPTKDNEIM